MSTVRQRICNETEHSGSTTTCTEESGQQQQCRENEKNITTVCEEKTTAGQLPEKPTVESRDVINKVSLKGTYWLQRIVFLRYLAFIYIVAFVVSLHQNKQLIGKHGLLPADSYLQMIKSHFGEKSGFTAFLNIPTLLIFVDSAHINWWIDATAYVGLFLSVFIFIKGAANMLFLAVLWLLYHSIVNVGQRWYSFGWESQLLESGFIAIFFVPLFSVKQLPVYTKPSWVVIWANRWLIFRIMIGAGLIKIRGDQCWRDLTCMEYHYETQPVPNPISYYLHQSPMNIHKLETLSNHFIELIAPFLMLFTRKCRIIGGIIQVFFQLVLIVSGNLSFLNWLTILPSLACFDDHSLSCFFSSATLKRVYSTERAARSTTTRTLGSCIRTVMEYCFLGLIAVLSIPVVQNLISSKQAMNTSFDSFRIVNTYGAFGSITKSRTEVIMQGTRNLTIVPDHLGGIWEEYEFNCKPGDVARRPCIISPYHYRLDWLMWFAAFMNYQQNPWLIHFAAKLLVNDSNATSLIAYNPFADGTPPQFVRGQHYKYEYTKVGSGSKNWWRRELIGSYFPPVDLASLRDFLRHHNWNVLKN